MSADTDKPERKKAAPAARKASPAKSGIKQGRGRAEGSKATQFQPGKSGNPNGKPRSLRDKVSHDLLSDILTVWNEANASGFKRGLDALRTLADTKPEKFVGAMVALAPKEIALDDETQEGFAGIWAALAKASASKDD